MPEETHQEVKNTDNDMEEKSENDKQNYQTDGSPYPWTDLGKVDHFIFLNYGWAG